MLCRYKVRKPIPLSPVPLSHRNPASKQRYRSLECFLGAGKHPNPIETLLPSSVRRRFPPGPSQFMPSCARITPLHASATSLHENHVVPYINTPLFESSFCSREPGVQEGIGSEMICPHFSTPQAPNLQSAIYGCSSTAFPSDEDTNLPAAGE